MTEKKTVIVEAGNWVDYEDVRISNHTKERLVLSLETLGSGPNMPSKVLLTVEGALKKVK